jgi:hypothetical protein
MAPGTRGNARSGPVEDRIHLRSQADLQRLNRDARLATRGEYLDWLISVYVAQHGAIDVKRVDKRSFTAAKEVFTATANIGWLELYGAQAVEIIVTNPTEILVACAGHSHALVPGKPPQNKRNGLTEFSGVTLYSDVNLQDLQERTGIRAPARTRLQAGIHDIETDVIVASSVLYRIIDVERQAKDSYQLHSQAAIFGGEGALGAAMRLTAASGEEQIIRRVEQHLEVLSSVTSKGMERALRYASTHPDDNESSRLMHNAHDATVAIIGLVGSSETDAARRLKVAGELIDAWSGVSGTDLRTPVTDWPSLPSDRDHYRHGCPER